MINLLLVQAAVNRTKNDISNQCSLSSTSFHQHDSVAATDESTRLCDGATSSVVRLQLEMCRIKKYSDTLYFGEIFCSEMNSLLHGSVNE